MRNGQVELLDSNRSLLARATIDTRYGVVWLAHPDKGQCGPNLARDDFVDCSLAQAAWIPQWVRSVRYANIALERCSIANRNVKLESHRDNLLTWWMPWPQPASAPYTRYKATFAVDTRECP